MQDTGRKGESHERNSDRKMRRLYSRRFDTRFFDSLKTMKESGLHPIIVHGGGPAINSMLEKLDIQSEFVDGLRKTTEPVLDTAEMILSGKMNKYLVSKIKKQV
ncbi:hypothetical protein [Sinobaca sp. H24]|uniref:amino acid kinase family protein n=1 Tax=Sinobaca sp. H24 TaxID=2923376 RepID=UPI00207A9403|nr:hypothetical protein [Sinobaca sp. H24]